MSVLALVVSFSNIRFVLQGEPDDVAFKKLVHLDMECLGCLLVEMLVPEKVRLVTWNLNQLGKKKAIVNLCQSNPKLLPRFVPFRIPICLNLNKKEQL